MKSSSAALGALLVVLLLAAHHTAASPSRSLLDPNPCRKFCKEEVFDPFRENCLQKFQKETEQEALRECRTEVAKQQREKCLAGCAADEESDTDGP
jgi:hypothetical protein